MVGEGLSSEDRATVAGYWWQRAEGEMTSWVGWRHVLDDMRVEGSPPAVIELAERAVADEWKHAMWCRDFALSFGHPGGDVKPRAEQKAALSGATDRENRLLRIALCCFTETVGCFTLQRVRDVVRDAELRKQNQLHLADELQHSRAGWAHLSTLNPDARASLRRLLPSLFASLSHVCRDGTEEDAELLVPHGYFSRSVLQSAHDEALHEVILPGLIHLNVIEAA